MSRAARQSGLFLVSTLTLEEQKASTEYIGKGANYRRGFCKGVDLAQEWSGTAELPCPGVRCPLQLFIFLFYLIFFLFYSNFSIGY